MRIVAGALKGRRLEAPGGNDLRPTSERARQAVFNIIEHGLADWPGSLEGASIVDLFCGTGALALEALSRGAAHASLIDNSPGAIAMAKKNAAYLGVWRDVTLLKLDATRLAPPPLAAKAPCGVAFVDAPYEQGLTAPALAALAQRGWLAKGGLCVAEVAAKEPLAPPKGYVRLDTRTWGAARVEFLMLAE